MQDPQNYWGIYKKPSITLTSDKFLNGKINITKMATLLQLTYNTEAILNKMPIELLLEFDWNITKAYLKE